MLRVLTSAVLAACLWLLGAGPASAEPTGEWTQFGNSLTHTGYYPRTIGPAPFVPSWSRPSSASLNPVMVKDGVVYATEGSVTGYNRDAFALTAADGTLRWRYPLLGSGHISPLTYNGGRLYGRRDYGNYRHTFCLDAAAGALQWEKLDSVSSALSSISRVGVTVTNGTVLAAGSYNGGLLASMATSGTALYSYSSAPVSIDWVPACVELTAYSCLSGTFYARHLTGGAVQWQLSLASSTAALSHAATPVISADRAVVCMPGSLVVVDLVTRSVAWSLPVADLHGTPAVAQGLIYVLAGQKVLVVDLYQGAVAGEFDAGAPLPGPQPLLTQDLLLVSDGASQTFVVDRATLQPRQVIPAGGYLSYASGRLYLAGPNSLATYTVAAVEDDPAGATPAAPAPPTPQPNPTRTLGTTSVPYHSCERFNGIAYFLFTTPAKLERFDLESGTWLTPISLPPNPSGFTVAASGIYVGYGLKISRFSLDGATELSLGYGVNYARYLAEFEGRLYSTYTTGAILDAQSGAVVREVPALGGFTILDAAHRKLYSQLTYKSILPDGTLEDATARFADGHTEGRVYPFGSDLLIKPNGNVYASTDLSFQRSLGGPFSSADFSGSQPVVARGTQLFRYDSQLLELGTKAVAQQVTQLYVYGGTAYSFHYLKGRGVEVISTPVATIVPPPVESAPAPVGPYSLGAVEPGPGSILFVRPSGGSVIHRWDATQRAYLTGYQLQTAPAGLKYAPAENRLYLAYDGPRIAYLDLANPTQEHSFNSGYGFNRGLFYAAGHLAAIQFQSISVHLLRLFSPEGALLAEKEITGEPRAYTWNAATGRLYYMRPRPNDSYRYVTRLEIGTDGQPGATEETNPRGIDPLFVSPDGAQVVDGFARHFSSLTQPLPVTQGEYWVQDAAWSGEFLATLGEADGASSFTNKYKVRLYGADRQLQTQTTIHGTPIRLLAWDGGWLLISIYQNTPVFSLLGADLRLLHAGPVRPPASPFVTTLAPNSVSKTGATFRAQVNPNGASTTLQFEYRPQGATGRILTGTLVAGSGHEITSHSLTVDSLLPGTTYEVRAVATNNSGSLAGAYQTFTTAPLPPTIGAPWFTENTPGTIQVEAEVNVNGGAGTFQVEYGLANTVQQDAEPIALPALAGVTLATAPLGSLPPGTRVYARARITNASGTALTPIISYTTRALSPTLGSVSLSESTATSVRLSATIATMGQPASWTVQYQTTSSPVVITPPMPIPAREMPSTVSRVLRSLVPGATYSYRITIFTAGSARVGPTGTFVAGAVLPNGTPAGGSGLGQLEPPPLVVTPINPAQPALVFAQDDYALVPSRRPALLTVLANDLGPAAAPAITSLGTPAHGTATVQANGQILYEPGATYRATDSFAYTFTSLDGQTSQATVHLAARLPAIQGTYCCLLGSSTTAFDASGILRLTVNAGGRYTGTLRLGAVATSFRGQLDANLHERREITTPAGLAVLQLRLLHPAAPTLEGTFTLAEQVHPFAAALTLHQPAGDSAPLTGRYTFQLLSEVLPQAPGTGILRLNSLGLATILGRTPAGEPFTAATYLGTDLRLPFYTHPRQRRDHSLHGWLQLTPEPTAPRLEGPLGSSIKATGGEILEPITLQGQR